MLKIAVLFSIFLSLLYQEGWSAPLSNSAQASQDFGREVGELVLKVNALQDKLFRDGLQTKDEHIKALTLSMITLKSCIEIAKLIASSSDQYPKTQKSFEKLRNTELTERKIFHNFFAVITFLATIKNWHEYAIGQQSATVPIMATIGFSSVYALGWWYLKREERLPREEPFLVKVTRKDSQEFWSGYALASGRRFPKSEAERQQEMHYIEHLASSDALTLRISKCENFFLDRLTKKAELPN